MIELRALLDGWRCINRTQYSGSVLTSVTTSSGQEAVPCTRICGGSVKPLAVASENNIATSGVRRILNAFCGNAIDVVNTNDPSGRCHVTIGHAIGVPRRLTVANSQVR